MKKITLAFLLLLPAVAITLKLQGQGSPAIDARFSTLTQTNGVASPVSNSVAQVIAISDSSASLASKYFNFSDALDAHKYYVWLRVQGTGTATATITGTDPGILGRVAIPVTISINDTDTIVASDIRATVSTSVSTSQITVTGTGPDIVLTNTLNGSSTAASDGTTTSGFIFTETKSGTSGSVAIASSAVSGAVQGWRICNDGVNTSTWLAVGQSSDPTVEGIRLDKGKCLECLQCTGSMLKASKVSSQASGNGYSVVQFLQ